MLDDIAPDTNPPHKNALTHALQDVKVQTGTKCIAIDETGVTVQDKNKKDTHIAGDTIIIFY